jgi:hypothetical protein
MNKSGRIISLAALFILIGGCAGTGGNFGSVSKTNQLMPGMSAYQVKEILGEPSQTQYIADKWVWKYSLHEYWKGWVPYYLVFGKETQKLDSWYADEAEYRQQQQLWLQAIPPIQ